MVKQRRPLETKSIGDLAYPFSAIVGQDEMKLALILNVIDPSIGGVLMMGHRGTAKSTAIRALADLLPRVHFVSGCLYGCDPDDAAHLCLDCNKLLNSQGKLARASAAVPVVDLPLGATEDRVCGSINIERALKGGERVFEPGLLARANRGFLYIDEVNLLEDHLVDLLLDVAVTGRNKVERENISIEHPARFVLIGSGNPEEGELRPQLLDRFGLYVEVKTENDPEKRMEIIERRDAFEREPEQFRTGLIKEQDQLRRKITRARNNFANVKIDRKLLREIAALCSDLKIDGHRGELTIMRSARALAAFAGRKTVRVTDVRRVAAMCLSHRFRRDALDELATNTRIEQALDRIFPERGTGNPASHNPSDDDASTDNPDDFGGRLNNGRSERHGTTSAQGNNGSESSNQVSLSAAVEADLPDFSLERGTSFLGKRMTTSRRRQVRASRTQYNFQRGRYAQAISRRRASTPVALDATLRALAESGYSIANRQPFKAAAAIRYKQFSSKHGTLFIFLIDASGSMALNRISHAKGALYRLLERSYINRDSVAIVAFNGTKAEALLPPSRSVLRARRVLDSLTVGGGTPLSAGLSCALDLAKLAVRKEGRQLALLLFTDGRANVPLSPKSAASAETRRRVIEAEVRHFGVELKKLITNLIIVDTNSTFNARSDARALAKILGGKHLAFGAAPGNPR